MSLLGTMPVPEQPKFSAMAAYIAALRGETAPLTPVEPEPEPEPEPESEGGEHE